MPTLANMSLDMINTLYADEKYTEALEGLRLLRETRNEKEFHRMIDGLIESCETKKTLKSKTTSNIDIKSTMAVKRFPLLAFRGKAIQVIYDIPKLKKDAQEMLEDMKQQPDTTIPDIQGSLLMGLDEMCEELIAKFGDRSHLDKIFKFWGKDAQQKYRQWCIGIIILDTLGTFSNSKTFGWQLPDQYEWVGGPIQVDIKKRFLICDNCQLYGNEETKTCSKCKKVRYCCKECQIAHWKTHKPNCH
jgi:MYND finger